MKKLIIQRWPVTGFVIGISILMATTVVAGDARIRELSFDENTVVRLDGCFGFQTMVEFGPEEHIENVGLGDASRWLVVPNKRANLLFVKPAYADSHSNMTVTTDRHRYSFELQAKANEACRRGAVVYRLRFRYPVDEATPATDTKMTEANLADAPVLPAPERRNSAYTFSGTQENIPLRVFDNGLSTYFQWAEGTATPAVYAVGADKSETAVSFVVRGDYLVLDQVAPAFILRRGNAVAVLYNDAYQKPSLDAASPQPRDITKPARGWGRWRSTRGNADAH